MARDTTTEMAAFDLPQEFRDKNGGCVRYTAMQLYPNGTAISGQRPGVTAPAVGQTTFQWNDDSLWWVPALSEFSIRGHFTASNGDALGRPPTNGICYADNWVSTLFSQVQIFVNSQSVELLQNPPQADTALLYSSVDRSFLKSNASSSGVGESLQTRLLNSGHISTAVSGANYNEVVATYRPAISLFDCASALPPGQQWRIDMSWASQAEQNVIEAVLGAKVAGTDYFFYVDDLTFYKVTLAPDMRIPPLMKGLVELNPVQVNIYQISGTNTGQFNVPLPATAERMLIVFQDNNSANNLAAGQNGVKAITSFSAGFSSGASDLASYIQTLRVELPELGYQWPSPSYNLTPLSSAGAKSDWHRAFCDWIQICRGSSGGDSGSVPFGNGDKGVATAVLAPLIAAPVMQMGNPENDQQLWVATATAGGASVSATTANQTALYGWLGRCPGPIFAVPVIRTPGQYVSYANINVQLSASATSVNMFVITSYGAALYIEKDGSGKYRYEFTKSP